MLKRFSKFAAVCAVLSTSMLTAQELVHSVNCMKPVKWD